jgi:hypothetical protein
VRQSLAAYGSAHLFGRTQTDAHGRPLRLVEERATIIGQELHARDARRFAVRHPWDRRTDRRGDAARSTLWPALHLRIKHHFSHSLKFCCAKAGFEINRGEFFLAQKYFLVSVRSRPSCFHPLSVFENQAGSVSAINELLARLLAQSDFR